MEFRFGCQIEPAATAILEPAFLPPFRRPKYASLCDFGSGGKRPFHCPFRPLIEGQLGGDGGAGDHLCGVGGPCQSVVETMVKNLMGPLKMKHEPGKLQIVPPSDLVARVHFRG